MNANRQLDLALAIAAVGLAFLGEFLFLEVQDSYTSGLLYFAGAVVMLILLVRRREPAEVVPVPAVPEGSPLARLRRWIQTRPIAAVILGLAVAVAYLIAQLMPDPQGLTNYTHVFALWIVSMALVVIAAFEHVPARPDVRGWAARHRQEILVAGGLTLVAGLLRFVALGAVPDVVSGDEGNIGWIALSVRNGEIKNMFSTTFGHSMLYLYGMAAGMNLLGTGPLGLRLSSALAGTLTVPMLYVLARRMFNPRVALLAAGLLAVSHFHIHFSRIIVAGSIQDALWATVIFYLFYSALETRSAVRMALAALAVGIHFHIYMGGRLILLLMPVLVAALFLVAKSGRQLVRANLGNLALFAIGTVVSCMPLAVWGLNHWPDFMARGNQVGIIQTGWLAQEAARTTQPQLLILVKLIIDSLLTVNHYPAFGFYYSKLPMLDFVGGALFMLGLGYAFYRVRDPRFLILHAWLWSAVVVGGALITQSSLAAYRILIIFPVVCLLVAVAVDRLLALAADRLPTPLHGMASGVAVAAEHAEAAVTAEVAETAEAAETAEVAEITPIAEIGEITETPAPTATYSVSPNRAGTGVSALLLAVALLAMGALNLKGYFVDYAPRCVYEDWGTRFASFMGGYLRAAGPEYKAYLMGAPKIQYGPHKSVDYLKGNNIPVTNIDTPLAAVPAFARMDEKSIYFFTAERQGELAYVEKAVPGGTKTEKRDCGELMMVVYRYDGAAGSRKK